MHSIWGKICLVNIILVDLTDFNANMALELGIAQVFGKPILLVGKKERRSSYLRMWRCFELGFIRIQEH